MYIIPDFNLFHGIPQDAIFETRKQAETARAIAIRQARRGLRPFPEEILEV